MTDTVPAHGPTPDTQPVTGVDYSHVRAAQEAQRHADLAAALPAERPADPAGQHTADITAEVAQEETEPDRDYPDGAIAVVLEGQGGRREVIHILDPMDWTSAANSAMQLGDMESWAAECLALDDYERIWVDLNPTIRQVRAMFDEWRRLTGSDAGKSLNSPVSLRRAARKSK